MVGMLSIIARQRDQERRAMFRGFDLRSIKGMGDEEDCIMEGGYAGLQLIREVS